MTGDELIEQALASYSEREPRPGMEQRVIKSVRRAQARRRAVWSAAGLAVAAGVLVTTIVTGPVSKVGVPAPRVEPQPVSVVRQVSALPEPPAARPVRARRTRTVKLFPSSPPMTQSERALLAFVQSAPDEVLKSMIEPQESAIRPIEIEEIVVAPLESEDIYDRTN